MYNIKLKTKEFFYVTLSFHAKIKERIKKKY